MPPIIAVSEEGEARELVLSVELQRSESKYSLQVNRTQISSCAREARQFSNQTSPEISGAL